MRFGILEYLQDLDFRIVTQFVIVKKMYFTFGWPRILRVPEADPPSPVSQVLANRDKIIFAILTHSSLSIWTSRVSP